MSSSRLVADVAAAAGTSELNAARLALQRFGTPAEVREVMDLVGTMPEGIVQWFRRLHDYCFWEKHAVEPFTRVTDDPEWTLFHGPDGPTGRELIVGFAGSSGNVNHSSPILLQRLDAAAQDLLIIRDLEQRFYVDGAGPATSFDELVEHVAAAAGPYRSVLTLGGSMGGGPALDVGVRIGARRAISLAGGPTGRQVSPPMLTGAAGDDGATGTAAGSTTTEVWCVYGGLNARDTEKAQRLAVDHPTARLLELPGISDHNVSHEAFLTGRMATLFGVLLSSDTERDAIGAPEDGRVPTVLRLEPSCTPPDWATSPRAAPARRSPVRRAASWLRRTVRARVGRSVHARAATAHRTGDGATDRR
jgi:hypothetical protein